MTTHTPFTEDDQPAAGSLLDQLRRDIRQPGPWASRFRALARAILQADELPLELTHAEVRDQLDFYVQAELSGQAVERSYSDIWQHLQTCTDCQADHLAILAALRQSDAESSPAVGPGRPLLSFQQTPRAPVRWTSRLRSPLAGAAFGLQIVLNPDFLKSALGSGPSRRSVPAYRSDPWPLSSEPYVLLIEDVAVDEQRLNVEISVTRLAERPDQFTLHAHLIGTGPLPQNLWIKLIWAQRIEESPIVLVQPDEGRAQIEQVSLAETLAALSTGEAQFEIVFEVRDAWADNDTPDSPH